MLPPNTADLLARTLYGEARSEGVAGMRAVACVILRRAAHPGWWGHDVASVIMAPWQFSCWLAEPVGELHALRMLTTADAYFRQAQAVAADALAGKLVDNTNGANSYANLALCSPAWAQGLAPCAVIGHHHFYHLPEPHAAATQAALSLPPVAAHLGTLSAPAQQPHAAPSAGRTVPGARPVAVASAAMSDGDRLNQQQLDALHGG